MALGAVNFVGANTARVSRREPWRRCWRSPAPTHASTNSLEAKLQPKTAQGFAKYVAAVEARRDKEIAE